MHRERTEQDEVSEIKRVIPAAAGSPGCDFQPHRVPVRNYPIYFLNVMMPRLQAGSKACIQPRPIKHVILIN